MKQDSTRNMLLYGREDMDREPVVDSIVKGYGEWGTQGRIFKNGKTIRFRSIIRVNPTVRRMIQEWDNDEAIRRRERQRAASLVK